MFFVIQVCLRPSPWCEVLAAHRTSVVMSEQATEPFSYNFVVALYGSSGYP
jgi:hypothetical protein